MLNPNKTETTLVDLIGLGGVVLASAFYVYAILSGIPFAHATTVTPIFGGGTGTSSLPSYGKVLVGDANGNYELTATSSLGFPVGGTGTVTSVNHSSPNSTLSISGTNPVTTTGTVNLDLNLAHSNWWTATQNFTNASTSELTATSTVWLTGYSNAILTVDGNGKVTQFGGTSACSSQFLTAVSASGSPTCASVNNADWSGSQLTVGNGGTGQTSFTAGQLLYGNSAAALSSVATTTVTPSNGLTYSGGAGTFSAVGGAGGTLGLATISANSVLANKTSSSAVPSAVATSSLFNASAGLTIGSTNISQIENRSFTVSTTTSWIGTSSPQQIEVGYGETWNYLRCSVLPTGATLDLDIYWQAGTATINHVNFIVASSTIGKMTITNNATITTGASTTAVVGTPTGSPTQLQCTVNDTI
jgi:hypothetical protein